LPVSIPFEPRRFRTTVPYYSAHRTPYPQRLIELIAAAVCLTPPHRVLDLGCGPGMLAIAFAPRTAETVAMDPEPEMLIAASKGAAEAGVSLTLAEGSSFDLSAKLGEFRLVTMGRSFHWMDRPATLRALDELIEPGGAVALFDETLIGQRSRAWKNAIYESIDRFSRKPSTRTFRNAADWRVHEELLAVSPFASMTRFGVIAHRELTIEDLIGRARSMSSGSPEAVGDRDAEFIADLRQRLQALEPTGKFVEFAEMSGLVARRHHEN
jgi:ubiquinone/menaquinone biosynthesis C-methylase UbiE